MINRESFPWSIKPIYTAYQVCKYFLFPLRIAIANIHDWRDRQNPTHIPVPPPRLRHRVAGSLDKEVFLKTGEDTAQNTRDLCALVDRDIYSFESILDFGCRSGRVLRNFQSSPISCHFYGTDIDSELIDWSTKNLTDMQFGINGYQPPLPYPDDRFDLIYAISVFTHLNEEYQHSWLHELQRIARDLVQQ
jgi:ubiquinone/menaquinone biosynthesis C-methylase UbiE